MVFTLQVNGSRGELTPLMHARVDTEFYQAAYAECLNTVVTRYGPHTRVPGTLWFGDTKFHAKKSRMLSFEFSESQLYSLEFGDLYVRFWTPEGRVESPPGTPYEIVSSYTEADLPFLHGKQVGDEMYLWCNGKRPQILKRMSETSWAFTPYKPLDGPYMDINDTATTLTLGNTQNVVPQMTANNAPSPTVVSCTSGSSVAYLIFSRDKTNEVIIANASSGEVTVDLGSGNAKVVDNYYLIADVQNAIYNRMPSQWDLKGSNNATDWVTLDSRDSEQGWASSETRYFETSNKQSFRYYRLSMTGAGADARLGGWYMHIAPDTQTPATLTASSTTGINNGTGFQTTDVDRPIRLKGSDGKWRWASVKTRVSTTQVTVVVYGQSFLDTSPIQDWALGAWSDTTDWARTGRFFEDRLAQAGWKDDPVGLVLSVSADYDNFRVSSPLVDDDAIKLRMTGGRLDIVQWLGETGTLIAGTGGGLRSIGGRDSTEVLKHDNLRQRLETSTAASGVAPATVDNVMLFIDRTMRRLYEVGYDYNSNGYVANEVSVLNDHLFKRGIVQLDYVSAPYCTAVALRKDGKIVFFTYDRGQKIAGGTLCDFGGFVEDIMVMAGRTYPDVWMIVRRVVDGVTKRFVERLAEYWDGAIDPDALPVYAASSRTYDDTAASVLTGLGNLAGKTVGIWADGKDIGDAVVTLGGELTLPYGTEAERVVIGERMTFRLKTLRLPNIGSNDGSGLGRKVRVASAMVDVFETARIYGGSPRALELLRDIDYSEHDPDLPEPMLTQMLKIGVDDSFHEGGILVIQGSSMYPATIRGISLQIEGEP